MAFDYGLRQIGVAMGNVLLGTSQALPILKARDGVPDWQALEAVVREWQPDLLIIGEPLNMDGTEGPRCQSTRAFARNLEPLTDLPITFWDERLSTVAAERALLEADTSRKRRAEVIAHVAAGVILQGALDRLRMIGTAT